MSEKVWICSACGEEACASGNLVCEDYRSASMVLVDREEYDRDR